MSYLVFHSATAARARSEAAYVTPDGAQTLALWAVVEHPGDGRAALSIPRTPHEAGIALGAAAYEALLTLEERAGMVEELGEDWQADSNFA
jgi:hypothetical protein